MSNPVAFITFRGDFTSIAKDAERASEQAGSRFSAGFFASFEAGGRKVQLFAGFSRQADRAGTDGGRRLGDRLRSAIGRPLAQLTGQLTPEATAAGESAGKAAGDAVADGVEQGARNADVRSGLESGITPDAEEAGRNAGKKAGEAVVDSVGDAVRNGDNRAEMEAAISEDAVPAGDAAGNEAGEAVVEGAGEGAQKASGGLTARLKSIFTEGGSKAGTAAGSFAGNALDATLGSVFSGISVPTSAQELGMAIGNQLKAAFNEALAIEAGTNLIQAQLGLSDADAAIAGSAAADVFRDNFGANIQEAQSATSAVMASFRDDIGGSEKALEGLTSGALTFAKISGGDVADAAQAAGLAVERGIAKDGTHAFDLFVAASQKVPANMRGQLTGAVDEYSDELARMGFSGEQAFGLIASQAEGGQEQLGVFGQALGTLSTSLTSGLADAAPTLSTLGLSAETIGTSFAAGGEQAAGAFDQIVDGLLGIQDPAARSAAAVDLFGEPLGKMGDEQLTDFLSSMDITKVSLDDVGGAAAEAGENMDKGLGARVEELKRRGFGALVDFMGETVVPALSEGATAIVEAFNTGEGEGILGWLGTTGREVYDWFSGTVVPGLQSALDSFRAGLEGTAGEGSFFADLGEGLVTISEMFTEQLWPIIQDVFHFLTNEGKPILIGLGIAFAALTSPVTAIAAGFIYLYQRFEWFRDGVGAVFKVIKGFYEKIWFPLIRGIWSVVKTYLTLVINYYRDVFFPVIGKVFTGIRGFVMDILVPAFKRIWTIASAVFTGVWDALQSAWDGMQPIFRGIWAFIVDTLVPTFQQIWTTAVVVFQGVWTALQSAWSFMVPIFQGIWTFITGTLLPVFQRIWTTAVSVFQGVWTAIQSAWSFIAPIFMGIVGFITGTLVPILQRIFSTAVSVFNGVWTAIQMAWGIISPIFSAIVGTITGTVVPIIERIWSVAQLVFSGFQTAVSTAWGFIQPIFGAVVGFVRDQLEARFNLFKTTIDTVWGAIRGAISGAWDFIRPKFQAIVDFVNETLVPVWDKISSAVGDAFDKVPDLIRGALRLAGDVVAAFLRGAAGVADGIGLDGIAGGLNSAAESADDWGGRAHGGRIFGGTPGKDSVPIMAMPGEYVQRRSAVSQWGMIAMEYLNRGQVPPGWQIPGYSLGGIIDAVTPDFVEDKLRAIAAGALEKVWHPLPWGDASTPLKGLPGFLPGGHNHLRERAIAFIKGEADRRLEEEEAKKAHGDREGVNPKFLSRFDDYSAAVGGLYIVSGFRSRAEQQRLYDAYLNGTGNLAAPPGRSKHERGLAIDHDPNSTQDMRTTARGFGLHYPVRGEPWHVEPMAMGGPVRPVSVHRRSFDAGGVLRPGWNVVDNKTGGPEPLVPSTTLERPVHLHVHVGEKEIAKQIYPSLAKLAEADRAGRR